MKGDALGRMCLRRRRTHTQTASVVYTAAEMSAITSHYYALGMEHERSLRRALKALRE